MKIIPRSLRNALYPGVVAVNRRIFNTLFPLPRLRLPDQPRVSFCTSCMGRLHHVRETLLANLRDNEDYPNTEFVLLDYRSEDGLADWARRELSGPIREGRVSYYRTDQPVYFRTSHAKNIAHRLATGDIVCNVDSDNFTGPSFARYVADELRRDPYQVLHGHYNLARGTTGRIALHRQAFLHAKGYSEDFQGWGIEDEDLIDRLKRIGLTTAAIKRMDFLRTIEHEPRESVCNMHPRFQDLWRTHRSNEQRMRRNKWFWRYQANFGRRWGRAIVRKNFGERAIVL